MQSIHCDLSNEKAVFTGKESIDFKLEKFGIWNFTHLIQNVGTSVKREINIEKLINQEGTMKIELKMPKQCHQFQGRFK